MPLPDELARESLIFHRLKDAKIELSAIDIAQLLKMTEGYSCSDLQAVVKEAAMVPVRELTTE
jgi:spastin